MSAGVRASADLLRHYREMVKAGERDLSREIQQALKDGVPAAELAKLAGISRARVYQIRDGRR